MDADETEMWAYGQGQWVIVDTLVRLTGKVKRIGYGHHTPALDDFPRSVINVQFVALAKITITQNVEPVSFVCAHPPTRCRYSTSGLGGFSMSDYIDTYYW